MSVAAIVQAAQIECHARAETVAIQAPRSNVQNLVKITIEPGIAFIRADAGDLTPAYKEKCANLTGDSLEDCLDRIWMRHMRRMSDGVPKGNPVRPVNPPDTYQPVNPSR